MPTSSVKQDKYVLGQSVSKELKDLGEEIRLDLSLVPNPNLNSGTIVGTIKDEKNNPISEALIKIMTSSHEPLAHAYSGVDGSYSFTPFLPGVDYHIYAVKKGYKLEEGIPFTLNGNQQVQKDFTLTVDPSAQLGVIAGDVFNATTSAVVKGAVVNLFSVDANNIETLVAISFTNEFGQFVFDDLELKNYIIRISGLGYTSQASSVNITEGGQISKVVVNLNIDPNTSRGTVSGIITDNNNLPVPDGKVVLYKVESDKSLTPIASTKTNSEGVYLFINVPQGNYKIKSNKTVIPQTV